MENESRSYSADYARQYYLEQQMINTLQDTSNQLTNLINKLDKVDLNFIKTEQIDEMKKNFNNKINLLSKELKKVVSNKGIMEENHLDKENSFSNKINNGEK